MLPLDEPRDDEAVASISVIGPGAVGGSIAAHLAHDTRHTICVAARTPFQSLEVKTGGTLLRSTPDVITDAAAARTADWVLVATKAYDTDSTSMWLRQMTGPDTVVAILQNGVEHLDRFAPFVPRSQLLPVVVNLPSHRLGAGRIVQRGAAALTVPESANGERFASLFAGTDVRVHSTHDFRTAAWSKLAFNATGAVAAVTLLARLDLRHAATEALIRQIVKEAIAVGRAEGARLSPKLVDDVVAELAASRSIHPNSLHADRLAGRRMEIDARNGAVVRLGAKHAIPTPVNAALVDLLTAIESAQHAQR
jgi:2-dehydropantoate 2-reductase